MRIIPFAREYAESNEFPLAQGQRVTVFLVREDGNPTIGEAWAEIQIKAEGELAPQQDYECRTEGYSDSPDGRCRYTTFQVLNTDQPSYTIHAADGPATYRVVRRDCTPVVAVYRTDIDAESCPENYFSHSNQVLAPPENFVGLFATAGAGDAGFVGVFASTESVPSETITGTLDFTLGSDTYLKVGVNASGNLVVKLGDPGHSGFWTSDHITVWGCGFSEVIPVMLVNDEMDYTGPSVPLHVGDHFGVWVGATPILPNEGPFDFELKQADLPARLVGYPFQAEDSEAQLFAVVEYCESVIYVPLNGRCTTLTGARPMIELTAPGRYAVKRPCAEGTGFFLSTGNRACVPCGGGT